MLLCGFLGFFLILIRAVSAAIGAVIVARSAAIVAAIAAKNKIVLGHFLGLRDLNRRFLFTPMSPLKGAEEVRFECFLVLLFVLVPLPSRLGIYTFNLLDPDR